MITCSNILYIHEIVFGGILLILEIEQTKMDIKNGWGLFIKL